jgi:hypothetical protein
MVVKGKFPGVGPDGSARALLYSPSMVGHENLRTYFRGRVCQTIQHSRLAGGRFANQADQRVTRHDRCTTNELGIREGIGRVQSN